jgi:hypothetical protein
MKIGYKGFDKDLKCKYNGNEQQFAIGEVTSKPDVPNPKVCTNQGFHYCNNLKDVFSYVNNRDRNRFCEVEILGSFTDGSGYNKDKSITTSLKPIREISQKEIITRLAEGNLNLGLVKQLQEKYPTLHVGGSIGLFLHGVRLRRWQDTPADIDFVAPYFFLPENFEGVEIEYFDCKKSGNDFDETFIANGIKVDYRIDPKQRYELIEYRGFKYKVSLFQTILTAKMKYANLGQDKHKDDISEMCGVNGFRDNSKPPEIDTTTDLPW